MKHPQSTHNKKSAIAMRNGFDSPAEGIDDADKSPRRKGNRCNDESQGNRPLVPAMPIVTALAGRSLASERQKPPIRRPISYQPAKAKSALQRPRVGGSNDWSAKNRSGGTASESPVKRYSSPVRYPLATRDRSNKKKRSSIKEVFVSSSDFSVERRKRFLTSLISPPALGATVLKVLSKRLDVWSPATVVCL